MRPKLPFRAPILVAGLAVGLAAPGTAAAQGPATPFAACPSLETLEAVGNVPAGTSFPCLGIATFSAGTNASERSSIVRRTGAVPRFDLDIVSGTAVLVPNARALRALASDPELVRLYPDRRVQAFAPGGGHHGGGGGGGGSPSGQIVPSGIARIGADTVWSQSTGAGIRVAIVDTGLDFDQTDLNPAPGCFFPSASQVGITSCQDDNGHGTHVAGIVAAMNNDQDVVGVAPDATPVAVKVLNQNGSGLDSEVVAGLQWVLDQGDIDVVNMSLGANLNELDPTPASCDDTVYGSVIPQLIGAGIVVVAAAGNDPQEVVAHMMPAGCTGVIAVASATAQDGSNDCMFYRGALTRDTASYFTTDGEGITISAPGERSEDWKRGCTGKLNGIVSLNLGGGTTEKAGTSMAAPHVAGVAALLLEVSPLLTPAQIACRITTGAQLVSQAPYDHPISGSDGIREGILSAPGALSASCS
jgi:subtilisin